MDSPIVEKGVILVKPLKSNVEAAVLPVLAQYPVKRAAFFGSFARATATKSSDADILVEFLPGTKGIEFFGLKADLEEALNRPVDLITYKALETADEAFRDSVAAEARVIYEHE